MQRNRQAKRTFGAVCGALALVAALTSALGTTFGAEPSDSAATLGARIAALPFVPAGETRAVDGFDAFGGAWKVDEARVCARGDSGSRLTFADPAWSTAKRGEIELSVRFSEAKAGFSGLCFKISDSGVGADAFNGYEIGFDPSAGLLNLGEHRKNYNRLQLVETPIPQGTPFRLRVAFDETGFDVYLDGEKKGSFRAENLPENDPLRAGTFAFRLWQNDVEYGDLRLKLLENADGAFDDADWQAVALAAPKTATAEYPETLALEDVPPFIYVARGMLNRANSVGNDLWQATPRRRGCAIRRVDPTDLEAGATTIFEDPNGSIYDMNLSFDAQTIYFSYRPEGSEFWNIWKIGVDGTGLTQLTDGPFFDVSPTEAADGRIVFVSTRRFGRTVCQPGPASNLFAMNADGTDIRCVSMNTLSDFNPQSLPDGRILFTRWEYIDRDLTYRQSLWTQNPEGTLYQLYYGNTIRDFGSILQARPFPNGSSSQVLATFTPHHGYPHGAIGVVDRSAGIEAPAGEGFVYWTKEFPVVQDTSREYAYRDPFPLDETRALCSFGDATSVLGAASDGKIERYRIWLLDCDGEKRLLWEEPELGCFCPIALLETPAPPTPASRIVDPEMKVKLRPNLAANEVAPAPRRTDGIEAQGSTVAAFKAALADDWGIPERTNLLDGDPVGQVVLADVYEGLQPYVKRGEVKSLRIMEQIRKTEELRDRAFDQSPSMGVATYYAKRCWGVVPVEEDGSANFYVPALREIYFQALDAEGREIQRMTSAVQFMPGESIGCVGCHEDRDSIPTAALSANRRPKAAEREPSVPILPNFLYEAQKTRVESGTNATLDAGVVDYPSLAQPVLDRYCVRCHEGADPAGGCDLSGDATRFFSASYDSLTCRSRSYRQADMFDGSLPPDQVALGKPLVQFYWLLYTTSGVCVPYASGALASRLPDYFKPEHCETEVDAESMARINFWLDSNAIYHGTYAHARPDSAGRRDRWAPLDGSGRADWFEKELKPIYDEKCASCHKNLLGGNRDLPGVYDAQNIDWTGRFGWINLTRPENSALLTAHLPKEAGGRGLSTEPTDDGAAPKYVFESKDDPTWQTLLKAIRRGKADAETRPDADRPGFQNARPEP
ncbi:MAG: hypothetical protein IKW13_09025 [Thermoguttaceae bacterium]|nr:hypothetical protein [Thermoguttaceae bacterium]